MTSAITQARLDLAASLVVAGLDVATNPKHAHAPCVLVGPVTSVEVQGACVYQIELPLYLIAPAPGDEKAVSWLTDHIGAVLDTVAGDVTGATLGTYDVGQGDLPAFEAIVSIPVKE